MYNYDTASEAINDLIKRGYVINFNIDEKDGIVKGEDTATKKSFTLAPDEFEIDEFHRFEGDTDPGDEMVVYAISSEKHHLKGLLVNAFGAYSNPGTSKVLKKMKLVRQ